VGVAKDLIAIGAAVGSLLYVGLSVLYDQFYVKLGLHPEDVGLTQAVILTRASAGLFVLVALGLAIGLVLFLLRWLIGRKQRIESADAVDKPKGRWLDSPSHRREIVLLCGGAAVLLIVGMFVVSLIFVRADAEKAKNGETVVSRTFQWIPTLSIESRECDAIWLEPDPGPEQLKDPTLHCLGSADGTTLFRTSSVTVRVPTSNVATTFNKNK